MKKEITWTTGTNQKATVTVELITSKVIDADGCQIWVRCCETRILATIDGQITGIGIKYVNHPVAVAKIGKLGISAANLDRINTAIAEIEATPEWQAKIEGEKIAARESEEYEIHHNAVKKMMAE